MLHLCQGNRLENLADRLLSDLAQPVGNVLAPELIAIQGQGVARWLSLWLASRQGIIANIQWLFPAEMVWHLFRSVLTKVPTANAFSAEALSWRVLNVLADEHFVQARPPLARYLEHPDPLRAWQLAYRLGQLYEQYLVYRPDWIHLWQHQPNADNWQAELWQRLISTGSDRHWLTLQREMLEQLKDDSFAVDRLPRRISLFALPGLSSAYLELLQAVSRYIDVNIYHQDFSQSYWAEIVSDKERARLIATAGEGVDDYLETGNRLLATMGRQGREHQAQLLQLEALETEVFSAPPADTLLGRIQTDIFELNEGDKELSFELKPDDDSLEVHVCHGAMREVEVLHDQLLDLFQDNHTLKPSDVLVLTPDIDGCAPFIKAVFGAATGNRHIPWCMADQGLATASRLVTAFFSLLDLPGSRFEANAVSALLDIPALCQRFGLTEADVEQVQHWIRALGICWGVDAVDIAKLDLPLGEQHTWRGGIDRLLLGHALGDGGEIFSGILPTAIANGGDAQVVGRVCTFLQQLFELRTDLVDCRPVVDWIAALNRVLDRFFRVAGDEEEDLRHLREHLAAMARITAATGYEGEIPLVVFRNALEARLATAAGGQFMTGAVTFAGLALGRCLPSRMVCLLGMNDEVFPGRGARDSLDQMLTAPRPGDRRRRDEDRHVFLEALLSASERLYISYTGRDARDDSECPPSVLVSELLDYIDSRCKASGNISPTSRLIVSHPLQAFSPRYFNAEDEKLFSYAAELIPPKGLRTSGSGPLLSRLLPAVESAIIHPETLAQFFSNPVRMLLRERLGILLKRSEGQLPTREPVALDFFTRRDLAEATLMSRLDQESRENLAARLRAGGKLPTGTPGDLLLAIWWQQVATLSERLQKLLPQESPPQITVDAMVDGIRFQANLNNVTDKGLIRHSLNEPGPHDLLRLWFFHLALNVAENVRSHFSYILTPGRTVAFKPVDNVLEVLSDLVAVYREGMTRTLAFFPRSAWAYVETTKWPDNAAARVWRGSEYMVGEADNAYYALAFRETLDTELEGEFPVLANRVFGPLRAHLTEVDVS